jgi:hypothetical protein
VVYFPEDGFGHTGNLLMPKPETLDQAFAEDSSLEAVGPYAQDEPSTDNMATRPIIYFPPRFAPIALANPTMTPRKAWESIVGLIRTGDDAEVQIQALQPLLDWIRAACTNLGDDHGLVSEAPSYPHPPVPLLDRAVEARLKRDLPGIVPGTGPQASTTMAINHLTMEMLRVNQDGVLREQTAKAKTPDSYYGQGVVILCRVTYSTTVQQLPAVYHDIAKSPKRMECQAVEERLRATADTLGLLDYVPAAMAALTHSPSKIAGCDFSHFDLQDLEAGIHPFGTTYRSPPSRTKLQQALSVYDDLGKGTGASLLDFQVLRETEKVGIVDSVQQTLELPPWRMLRLVGILAELPWSKTRITTKRWQQILGELRSMVLAVPGLRGLFSLLQEALRHETRQRICLTTHMHDFLDGVRWIVQDLHNRPTGLRELVDTPVAAIGASDAAAPGSAMASGRVPLNHGQVVCLQGVQEKGGEV